MLEKDQKEAALREENNNLKKTIDEIKVHYEYYPCNYVIIFFYIYYQSALPKKKPKSEPSENGIKAKSDKALDKTTSTITVFEVRLAFNLSINILMINN